MPVLEKISILIKTPSPMSNCMRQIQIILPDRDVKKVLSIARESNLNAAHVRSAGEIDLVIITVHDEMVNDFITKLKGADIDKVGTVSIMPIHASLSHVETEKPPSIAPKEEIIESARRFERDGVIEIPMPAMLACGSAPEGRSM